MTRLELLQKAKKEAFCLIEDVAALSPGEFEEYQNLPDGEAVTAKAKKLLEEALDIAEK